MMEGNLWRSEQIFVVHGRLGDGQVLGEPSSLTVTLDVTDE
jgi:hypothetical protein